MGYKKIAIVKLSAMGDIIHAMIVLQFIKKYYKNILIDWIVEENFSKILELNSDINKIYTINLKSLKRNKFSLLKEIRKVRKISKNNYDLVIDMQGLLKSAIVSRMLSKEVIGFDKNSIREKIASIFYSYKVNALYEKNVIERNLSLALNKFNLNFTKEDIINKKPFLFYKENKDIEKYFQKNKKNIILVVGASWDSKIYSKDKYIELINSVDENFIIIWGNEKEKNMASYIVSNTNAVMTEKINLNDLKFLISKGDLLIGSDTGPSHIAWALNIPSILLFGNTPGYRNTFLSKNNRIIESKSNVNPLKIDKEDYSIRDIKVEEIIKEIKELIYG